MDLGPVHYLPIITTVLAVVFVRVLWTHYQRKPSRHLLWWTAGVAIYGIGTATEAITTVFGWSEPVFRTWYIAGALLGGAPLAQGTVYLLLKKRTADRLTVILLGYVMMASAFVLATPINQALVESHRLSGTVMEWQWVRLFSPLANTYAVIFLVGGAIWSAVRYRRSGESSSSRVAGNWAIAIGAILPGIGGGFARAGLVEVLYVGELVGLLLIWHGYRLIVSDRSPSIHVSQQLAPTTSSNL